MLRTLFYIPHAIGGWPVFGWGWAVVLWWIVSAYLLWQTYRPGGRAEDRAGQWLTTVVLSVVLIWFIPHVEEAIQSPALLLPPVAATHGLPIRGYGAMLLIAVVSGIGLAMWRATRAGLHPDTITSLAFAMVVGGIVGARGLFVVQYWQEMRGPTWAATLVNVLSINQGGLVVYGSLFGAALAFMIFTRRHALPPLALADLIAPSLSLGLAWGRIGCLLNGCCYGGPCDLSWAISFPFDSPPYHAQKQAGELYGFRVEEIEGRPVLAWLDPQGPLSSERVTTGEPIVAVNRVPVRSLVAAFEALDQADREVRLTLASGRELRVTLPELPRWSLPIHPTQLYDSLTAFLITAWGLAYYPFRRRHGEVIVGVLLWYAGARFLLERIRVDERPLGGWLTISEAISIVLAVAMVALWWYIRQQPRLRDATEIDEARRNSQQAADVQTEGGV